MLRWMESPVDRFLERFVRFGEAPGVQTYLALFHPDATLFDSGMERPIGVPEIPEHIESILKLVPDFTMTPERWRERDGTLFVEARNAARLGPRSARWRSIYCVDLEGDRVIRGRRYYDRRALFALLDPTLPVLVSELTRRDEPQAEWDGGAGTIEDTPAEAGFRAWLERIGARMRDDACLRVPGQVEPLGRERLAPYAEAVESRLPGLTLERVAAAGDAELGFIEWQARARAGGRELAFGVAGRFDGAPGGLLHARLYFDSLAPAQWAAGGSP